MIKIKQLLAILSFSPIFCLAQTSTENYVKTETLLNASGSSSIKSVQYLNGLGYPSVSAEKVGGSGQTAYSLVTYDALGREICKYLPVSTDSSIDYKTPDAIASIANSSSGYNDNTAYSKNQYDALDRPVSVTTAGASFASKPSKIVYSSNVANEVIRYGVGNDNTLTQNSYYPANKLTKETSIDPDGKKSETFKDLFGNVILQRVNGSLCTYYVYDNLGCLRFVLPPKYQTEKDIAKTGYEYRYDDKGRVVYKKLPGAEYCEFWYDDADRMICMQDGEMRDTVKHETEKKRFFIYDKFDHLVVQGLCSSCLQSGTVQNATFSTTDTGILGTCYVMPSAFTSALKDAVLEVAYYYDGNQNQVKSTAAVYKQLADIQMPTNNTEQKTKLTAAVSSAAYGQFVAQTMFYDNTGNLIKTRSKEIGERLVSNVCTYSYTNKLKTSDISALLYGDTLAINQGYEYNANNDQKSSYSLAVKHGTASTSSFSYSYDKLGRMSQITRNSLPSSVIRTVNYAYDMHGWLTKIATNSFTEELFYADGLDVKYYNGNISGIKWKDYTQEAKRGYRFYYDGANRMTSATYAEGDNLTSNSSRYNERMSYDANGNITKITRYGKKSSGYGLMDYLNITYSGNQLANVTESIADYDYTGSFEYKKAKGSQYKYNKNGSLIADKSRGIAYITYDFNNNPKQIYFINGNVTKYIYSATGQKLRVVHYTAKPNIITRQFGTKPTAELTLAQTLQSDSTDYLLDGSLLLKNGKIDKFLFDGGYAQAMVTETYTDSLAFYYYNKDHLGNNREVVDANGNVVQVTNYYPFGAPYADASAVKGATIQQYKYNGKELDTMHGLNSYDYGARQDDPILGRWNRIDPLCEKYYGVSPYVYCLNNPIFLMDPDGRDPKTKNRIWGAIQMVGGAFEMIGSGVGEYVSGGAASPMAVPLFLNGVDNFSAGFQQVWTGEEQETVLHKTIESTTTSLGASPSTTAAVLLAADFSTLNVKSPQKAGNVISNAKTIINGDTGFRYVSKYGISTYNSLKKQLGSKSGLQVHHLIEKRFSSTLHTKEGDMLSIVLTKEEHAAFTKAWRNAIPYDHPNAKFSTRNANPEDIWGAAREIYKNYPEILNALGL